MGMTRNQYIIECAELPFELPERDNDGQKLLSAVPQHFWDRLNTAKTHEAETKAGDLIAAWIQDNWRTVLPHVAENFPLNGRTLETEKQETLRSMQGGGAFSKTIGEI